MKPNAIEPKSPDFPPDIYDVEYELLQVLKNADFDPNYNPDDLFIKLGCITMYEDTKFYNLELYRALFFGKLIRHDYDTNNLTIDNYRFTHCYRDSFKAGRENFDRIEAKRQHPKDLEEYGFYVTFLKGRLNKCKSILKKRERITIHSMEEDGRHAGEFSRIIELIQDDFYLQQQISELASKDLDLQQRIKKLINFDEVTPLLKAVTPQQTLSKLITHQNGVKIVEGIKIQYKNIKGKRLKLLLLALQELDLLPKERIAKKFHDCCKAEFDWKIATYQAMNDHQYNKIVDLEELDNMKQYIEKVIKA